MEIFKPQLFSSHATRLHKGPTEFFLMPLPAETICWKLLKKNDCHLGISISVNILFSSLWFAYLVYIACCCLFTCLYPFYIDVIVIFLFILWPCKQDHYFVFVAFVYTFNKTISIFGYFLLADCYEIFLKSIDRRRL